MDRSAIIATLRKSEAQLRARGVAHAALFGSRARLDHGPASDIDIIIEFEPSAPVSVWDYVAIKEFIADLFSGPVDVVSREGLKAHIRPSANLDAVYAF